MPGQPPSETQPSTRPTPDAAGADSATPPSLLARLLFYRRLWILAALTVAMDQLTKRMVAARLPIGSYGPQGQIEIIPGFFNIIHVGNTGAAWSMFSGRSTGLALLAAGTLAAIFYWRRALGLRHPSVQIGFGLLCGGIVGNLIDRIRLNYVVDYLDFHFGSYTYPTFNVADSAIFLGVCWYVLWSLKNPAANHDQK